MVELVLSLFPGIDLLGMGFELEGFCVVRGPDKIFGQDIRSFSVPSCRIDGVIGGPPCQDFSKARRNIPPTGEGVEMLTQFTRVVTEAQPLWFLMENVPQVPDISVSGYKVQRIDINANECGLKQRRLRHFQFGSREGMVISPKRSSADGDEPTCTATESNKPGRRGWADFCELQGLPRDFRLDQFTQSARYRAVGNGVPIPMARIMARAIRDRQSEKSVRLCICGCGRLVHGRQIAATAACRKRMERRRKRDASKVTNRHPVTPARSQLELCRSGVELRSISHKNVTELSREQPGLSQPTANRRQSGVGGY